MYIGNFYFNIIYLHNRNIVVVARSQLFNISVHLLMLLFNCVLYIAF